MKLYLIQHGNAFAENEDPARALTPIGISDAHCVGQWLHGRSIGVPEIWHSGKLRTRQTAEILAQYLAPQGQVQEKDGLNPKDSPAPLLRELGERREDLAIIGHLPHLTRLAGALLAGDKSAEPIAFQQAGVVCLQRTDAGSWQIFWMVTPQLLRK